MLCVALVDCGGNDPAKDYIGTWEAVEVTAYDETLDEESLSEWKQFGDYFYFELNEDGTVELTNEGKAYPGTWTVDKEGKASFESDTLITAALELKDGQLIAKYDYFDDPRTVICKRIDPSAKIQAPTLEEYYNESEEGIENSRLEGTIDDLTDATKMDVVAVDDDLCTIKIVGKGLHDDMPSVVFELTNKSDQTITIMSEDGWTAGGIANNPGLDASLRAGETCSVLMYFYPEEIGNDPSALTDVSGKIMVLGPVDSQGFAKVIKSYDVSF